MRALHTTTTLLRSAALVGTLACACTTISLPCLGQEQVSTVGQAGTLVWRGTKGPATPPPEDLSKYNVLLSRELAAIQAAETVDGVGTETEQRLNELWVRAALERDYPGRWELLVELALVRMGRDARRGWLDSALEHGNTLLPHHGTDVNLARYFSQFDLVEADAATLRKQQARLGSRRLISLRARLAADAQPVYAASGAPAQNTEDAVRQAVLDGHAEVVLALGGRAGPTLEALVLSQMDEMPEDVRSDPLVLLFEVSELRGAQFVLDNWGRGGFLFKKRLLRAMREADVLENPGTWSFTQMPRGSMEISTEPPRLAETIWLDVLTCLATDPEVTRDSLGLVGFVATFDGLNAPLQGALIAALDDGDPDRVNDVVKALDNTQGRASVVPVLEHALDHPLPQVSAFAAERLALYPRSDALRARADHPDLAVRRAAVGSLVGMVGQAAYRQDGAAFWVGDDDRFRLPRSVDERDVGCLTRLLEDVDAGIRETAVEALVRHPELQVPSDLILSLTRDANAVIRREMARWRRDQPADPALLELLATDTDPAVLESLDKRLDNLARTAADGTSARRESRVVPGVQVLWNDTYLDALLIRIANHAAPFDARYALRVVGRDAAGATTVVRQAVATRNRGALYQIVQEMGASAESRPLRDGGWQGIPGEELRGLIRTVRDLPPDSPTYGKLVAILRSDWPGEALTPLLSILSDQTSPADLRLAAAMLTASRADAAWREQTLEVLKSLGERPPKEPLNTQTLLGLIPSRLPSLEARTALLVDLVRTSGIPGWAVTDLSEELLKNTSVPEPLAVEVLERYGDRTGAEWRQLVLVAIENLRPSEEEPRLELVGRLLASPLRDVPWATVVVLGRSHLDTYLPLLEDALLGRGYEGSAPPATQSVQRAAAAALASYLDDQAAEILLKGLGSTTDTKVRDACFAALETIRRYQDEKDRWAQRKSSKQARDAAIAELVPMLADSDTNVRAQAARSLGALGAVEQLPALVRMLKDPDATVRAAAQAAIEALTATPEEG